MLLLINETGSGEHVRFEETRTVLKNGDCELPIEMRSALIDLIKQCVNSYESSVMIFPGLGAIVENKEVRVEAKSELTQDIILYIMKTVSRYQDIAKTAVFNTSAVLETAEGNKFTASIRVNNRNSSVKIQNGKEAAYWTSAVADSDKIKNFEETYQGLELHAWTYCPSFTT